MHDFWCFIDLYLNELPYDLANFIEKKNTILLMTCEEICDTWFLVLHGSLFEVRILSAFINKVELGVLTNLITNLLLFTKEFQKVEKLEFYT